MTATLISVVIPTYNRAQYLAQAIQSVLDQTHVNLEVIVVDDGSTDGTAAVLANIHDRRLRVIHQENAGPSAARNTGIRHAAGEWLTFLDSDDLMLPRNLSLLSTVLATRQDVDVAYGWFYFMNADGSPLSGVYGDMPAIIPAQLQRPWSEETPHPSGTQLEGNIAENLLMEIDGTLALGCALIRRECVEKISGFDSSRAYMEHWDFYLRLALAGCRYACIRQAVLNVRLHDGGLHNNLDGMLASRLSILDAIFAQPDLPEVFVTSKSRAYLNTYLHHACHHLNREEMVEAADCIHHACLHGQPDGASLTPVINALTSRVLKMDPEEGRRALDAFIANLPAGAIRRQIYGPARHQLDIRAFSESRKHNHRLATLKLGARCGLHQPNLVLNSWWLRNMLDAGLGHAATTKTAGADKT